MTAAEEIHFEMSEQLPDVAIAAVEETMQSILGIKTTVKNVSFENKFPLEREISGVMGFIQNDVEGTLALSFENKTAYALLGKFYGMEIEDTTQEVTEGIAELTNMIHAIVKEKLNQQGFSFQMCLPFVVVGNQHQVFQASIKSQALVELESDLGPFWCEIIIYNDDDNVKTLTSVV